MARALLPLRLEEVVDATAPIDCRTQFVWRDVRELGRPMSAEAGANNGDLIGRYFRTFEQIIEHGEVSLMRVGSGEHRAFSRSRAVDDEAAPTFFDERFTEGMALFFPVVDAAPMHHHRRGQFLRQP